MRMTKKGVSGSGSVSLLCQICEPKAFFVEAFEELAADEPACPATEIIVFILKKAPDFR
jgi:hypothetical protein